MVRLSLVDYSSGTNYYELEMSENGITLIRPISADNSQPIFGVHGHVSDVHGAKHEIGYFSRYLREADKLPDYERSLFVFVDSIVVDFHDQHVRMQMVEKLWRRNFVISKDKEILANITYRWPFYRERLARDDYNFISKDICYLAKMLVASTCPKQVVC